MPLSSQENSEPSSFLAIPRRMGNAFVALDAEDRWLYANGEAERMLGRSGRELVGQAVWEVYPEARGTALEQAVRRARAEGNPVAVSDCIVTKGRWVECLIHPLPSGVLYVHLTDFNEHHRAPERAEHLASLTFALSEAVTTQAVTAAILAAALPPFAAWIGVVTLLTDGGEALRVLDAVGLEEGVPDGWREFPLSASVPLADAARRGELVVALTPEEYEASAYQHVPSVLRGPGEQEGAIIAAPLLLAGRVIGSLGLVCPPERVAGEDARTFLLTVAGQCAVSLERARLFDAERRAREASEAARAEAEQALATTRGAARQQAFFASLVANSTDFIGVAHLDRTPQFLNAAGRRLVGLGEDDDLSALKVEDFFFPEDRDSITGEFLPRLLREGQGEVEARFRHFRTGMPIWVRYGGFLVPDPDTGEPAAMVSISQDITDRRHTEDDLRRFAESLGRSEERYRALVDASSQVVWTNSPDGRMWGDQAGWATLTGQSAAQYQGFGWAEAVHPDDRQPTVEEWNRCVREQVPFLWEHRVRRHDDVYRTFAVRAVPVLDGDHIREWVGIHTDVTEQRANEAALRGAAQRGAVLNRLNTVLRSSFDPDEIESAAVTILGEALAADRCYGIAYHVAENYSTATSEYRSRPDDLPPMAGPRYTLSRYDAVMRDFHLSPEAQVVEDVRLADGLDADTIARMEALGLRSYIRVPLYEAGALVGSMAVAMADAPRAWTPEEVELLKTAAAQVRAVVEAARAHKELEEDRAKQRKIADTLQNAMLVAPPEDAFPGLSVGTHYEPAWDEARVGGDFYDALQLGEGRVALICGDGTGKGLEAARYVSESLFVLRAYLRESPDPAAALVRLNNYMIDAQRFDRRPESALAAVVVAVIDTRTGIAQFAAGGAEPPLVVRAATGEAEEVSVFGVVLGANPQTDYDAVSLDLNPGDLIVMSTDGTTEARDRKTRQFFGYEGLLRAAEHSSEESGEFGTLLDVAFGVVERAKGFAGGKLGDDACVVVARYSGGAPVASPPALGTT